MPGKATEKQPANERNGGCILSRMRNDRKSGWKRFFTGKGFYVALAVCLVAVCGVAVATFVDTLPKTQEESSGTPGTSSPLVTSPTTEQPVDNPVSDVPYERPTTTTPTTAATKPPTTPVDTKPADLFMLPIGNEVLKPFSDGQPVYSETMQDWRTHNGTDFKGEKGTEVKAVADGTIRKVENDPLWGPVIEIDHGFQIISRYCGVTAKELTQGQKVKVGDVIGNLAEIPVEIVEEPHLHLEIQMEGKYVDPVAAIGRETK